MKNFYDKNLDMDIHKLKRKIIPIIIKSQQKRGKKCRGVGNIIAIYIVIYI